MYLYCKLNPETIEKDQVKTQNEDKKQILCYFCNNPVTDFENQIVVNNAHQHVFANPHGLVFEIACYREAMGCATMAYASNEFTWFPGYEWKIAVCTSCQNHLGWKFISSSDSFYGLICDKLIFP